MMIRIKKPALILSVLFVLVRAWSPGLDGCARAEASPPTPTAVGFEALELKGATGLEEPVDAKAYRVVVGDRFVVSMGRKNQAVDSYRFAILPQGKALLPFVGAMAADGMTLDQFISRIEARYKKAFPEFEVAVLLESMGTYSITVIGTVTDPGIYEINSVTRLSAVIRRAGGLPPGVGSMRRVEVILGGESRAYDLQAFYLYGDFAQNPHVLPGAVVKAPTLFARANISGEVFKPGDYELIEGESILDLIGFAGGLTSFADPDSILVQRYIRSVEGDDSFRKVSVSLEAMNDGAEPPLEIEDGDSVMVYSFAQTKGAVVQISGAVRNPGKYASFADMKISDLVYMAGGYNAVAPSASALHISHDREGNLLRTEFEIRAGVPVTDRTLKPGDRVYIYNPESVRGFVSIEGAVASQGYYPFIEGQTAFEVVNMAGGIQYNIISRPKLGLTLAEQEAAEAAPPPDEESGAINLRNSFILRQVDGPGGRSSLEFVPLRLDRIIFARDMSHDMPLRSGDRIFVARDLDQVIVNGFVESPGMYPFVPNMTASYYVNLAGLTNAADLGSVTVVRADGAVVRDSNAVVFPGDAVTIHERASRERERRLSFYGNMITTLLVIYNSVK